MSTCVNCPQDAVFQVADPGADALVYCRSCLPPHLHGRSQSGQLDLPVAEEPVVDEPVAKKRK